ncbi:uncharacterized protein H6S33_005016 [Morchella sextelata]|jgi:hypothetical protein|uniref:uncharacterized protein n=1 Tax=Morchella sextelata TaxID=1174677 RepID=UPI001D04C75D|nr:uncharacterized protein H6S33_005016 [Morchella sextelata]KAH0605034.1 hypothetical protein H6S33_005016 [Morchella sextelata]
MSFLNHPGESGGAHIAFEKFRTDRLLANGAEGPKNEVIIGVSLGMMDAYLTR